jgi:hypothetical protein
VLPDETREAVMVAETFQLFYVLKNYLRDFILNVLSEAEKENWWNTVPKDVRDKVAEYEDTEESKRWMNLNPRGEACPNDASAIAPNHGRRQQLEEPLPDARSG